MSICNVLHNNQQQAIVLESVFLHPNKLMYGSEQLSQSIAMHSCKSLWNVHNSWSWNIHHQHSVTTVHTPGIYKLYSWATTREHVLKWLTTSCLRLNVPSHKLQQNRLTSECTTSCCLNSDAVKKRFEHSPQTYGFTSSCRSEWLFNSPRKMNFFWHVSHVNEAPSSCDFSRCCFSWLSHLKHSEQCLHEYFARVWTRMCIFTLSVVLNSIPQ